MEELNIREAIRLLVLNRIITGSDYFPNNVGTRERVHYSRGVARFEPVKPYTNSRGEIKFRTPSEAAQNPDLQEVR
jgi:hypothetical protein